MTVWAVFLSSVALALAFPAAEAATFFFTPKRPFHAEGSWLETLPMVAAGGLIAIWIFVFWSLIGSFLNVVVYRLPLGQSVVHGGSRCPRCASPIKWHDNLPVIGWLNLNGRCRSCDLPIAARYPIVESICAGLGTAVYFRELLSGGANLPGRIPDFLPSGVLRLFPSPAPDLVGLSLYHCVMLCVLLVWGLIAWDGRRVPGRSILWVLGVAVALPVVFPSLHPLGIWMTGSDRAWPYRWPAVWRGCSADCSCKAFSADCCGVMRRAERASRSLHRMRSASAWRWWASCVDGRECWARRCSCSWPASSTC